MSLFLRSFAVGSLAFGMVACGGGARAHEDLLHVHNHAPDILSDGPVLQANAEDAQSNLRTRAQGVNTLPFGLQGDTTAAQLTRTVLLSQGLNRPSSLAFKPVEGSLWISNRGDDTTVVIDDVGTAAQKATQFFDDSDHFMNNPTQLAFSLLLPEFAVSLESTNDYNGQAPPNYFTGPALYTSDRQDFEGGTMSHLDMLHHSPLAMGISVGARPTTTMQDLREYWVFNGMEGSVDRYFFRKPHELGGHDHTDGITVRYAAGQLLRQQDVPGHFAFDQVSKQLFIADTGNGRVVRLDTRGSLNGARRLATFHAESPLYAAPASAGGVVEFSDPSDGLEMPSGVLLYGEHLLVGDYGTGHIKIYALDGELLATVVTGLGRNALTGLAVGPDEKLYVLDVARNRLLRMDVKP